MTDKQIMIDGVDVSECKHLYSRWPGSLPKDTCAEYDYINNPEDDGLINLCKTHPNCYYKQLQKEKFENLNNRQMVESAENLIYENSELYKNLKEKEQECESLKEELNFLKNNEDLLISELQVLWGKQIAKEQGDCKNIDYLLPRTKEIYHKITEIERTLKDVAFAQSVKLGKTKPLGDTGSPRSYKRWEKRERQLLEREFLK